MELGPVQKDWIGVLRKHPERQHKDSLGFKIGELEKYCCLGQLLVCYIKHNDLKEEDYFNEKSSLIDSSEVIDHQYYPNASYKLLGLVDGKGTIPNSNIGGIKYDSLAKANDEGATWLEIADFVEKNPELVFTKSV